MKPKELHETRDSYELFKPTTFRCHIKQSISTAKHNHTLKLKVDSKLKKTMVKYDLGDVDVDELKNKYVNLYSLPQLVQLIFLY